MGREVLSLLKEELEKGQGRRGRIQQQSRMLDLMQYFMIWVYFYIPTPWFLLGLLLVFVDVIGQGKLVDQGSPDSWARSSIQI